MRTYNGFTEDDRNRLSKPQYEAKRRGLIQDSPYCYGCGAPGPGIVNHVEDYRDVVGAIRPLCWWCHTAHHFRDIRPHGYEHMRFLIESGYRWVRPPGGELRRSTWHRLKDRMLGGALPREWFTAHPRHPDWEPPDGFRDYFELLEQEAERITKREANIKRQGGVGVLPFQ